MSKTKNPYSLNEMIANGFFDWTVIETRPATADEADYGCTIADDCGCCDCDETAVSVVTYAGIRWSETAGRMVERMSWERVCVAHA